MRYDIGSGPPSMIETRKSFCRFCHAVCGIEVDLEDGRPVAVRGDREHPISRGYLCIKGRALLEQHDHPERLRGSRCRAPDGSFVEIGSERAMDEIAARLGEIVARHGPTSVAAYSGTHGLFGSGKPLVPALLRALGSHWYFTPNTIDQPSQQIGWARHGSWNAGVHRFADADTMLFVGNNPGVSAFSRDGGPPYADGLRHLRDAKRRGLRIIAIDPRRTELAKLADLHLQVKPGEDPTLLAGLVREILAQDLVDRDFVARHVRGEGALRAAVDGFSPGYVERRAGVAARLVQDAARLWGTGRRGAAMTCTGVNMAPRPDVTQHLVLTLNSLCGRFNRAGDPVRNPGALQPPRARHAEVEAPREIWGDGPWSRFRGLGRFVTEMPINVFADEILTPGEGQIRALLCVGGNPAVAFPDQRKVLAALAALELLVVLDVKLTETARFAHYAIGCKLSLEKPGTSRTAEPQLDAPFAQHTPALVSPAFDVVEEWEVLWGLAHRMGLPLALDDGRVLDTAHKPSSEEYLDFLHVGSRVPLDEVRRYPGGRVFVAAEPVTVEPARPGHEARFDVAPPAVIEQLHAIRREAFSAAGGYGEDARFSHRLISRRMNEVYNSTGDHLPRLRKRHPYNPAFLCSADLRALGVARGEVVRIESEHDFIYAVAEASDDVRPGAVSLAHARGGGVERDGDVRRIGSNTGRLVSCERDFEPVSGIPRQSAIPVNVRRLRDDERRALG